MNNGRPVTWGRRANMDILVVTGGSPNCVVCLRELLHIWRGWTCRSGATTPTAELVIAAGGSPTFRPRGIIKKVVKTVKATKTVKNVKKVKGIKTIKGSKTLKGTKKRAKTCKGTRTGKGNKLGKQGRRGIWRRGV